MRFQYVIAVSAAIALTSGSGRLARAQSGEPATQTPASSTAAPASKDTNPVITLSGCVSRGDATPEQLRFFDTSTGDKYRLSGLGLRKYVGQRVEIVGGPVRRRLTIRGGFVPSANVAAQAGAIDPAQAAIAALPGGPNTGTGNVPLPEFRVTRVKSLDGSCQ